MSPLARALMLVILAYACACGPARPGTRDERGPVGSRGVGVQERRGALVPAQLLFTSADGPAAPLVSWLRRDVPTLLVFAYARCRALCSVVLHETKQLMSAAQALRPGRDYQVLLVGLDPAQSLEDARRQRAALTTDLHASEREAVTYLVGEREAIRGLATAVGYAFRYDSDTEQYVHPAVLVTIDPAQHVSGYLHALGTEAGDFEAALREAHAAQTGRSAQAALVGDVMRCFRFDPALRRHREAIALYFRVGGALIFGVVAALVTALVRWERRRAP